MDDTELGFIELRQGDGTVHAVLARDTLQIHVLAVDHSLKSGDRAFVGDEFLTAVEGDTPTAALELESEGLWRRETDGYRILDILITTVVRRAHDRLQRNLPWCNHIGRHTPIVDDPQTCAVCGTWLQT